LITLKILGEACKLWCSSLQSSPASCHFLPLRSKFSSHHAVLKHPQFMPLH
jgi:hypothetical protein